MKIGVIADIHGDIDALDECLSRLERQEVDTIVCAGDIVGKGPNPLPVIERINDLQIPCIEGNHERFRREANAANDLVLKYIEAFPATLQFVWEGLNVLLAHGAPWSDMVYIFSNTERHVLKRIALESKADVVILGHTHAPLTAQIGKMRICNPGSVCGTHTAGSRTFGILNLPNFAFDVFEIATGNPVTIPHIHLIR